MKCFQRKLSEVDSLKEQKRIVEVRFSVLCGRWKFVEAVEWLKRNKFSATKLLIPRIGKKIICYRFLIEEVDDFSTSFVFLKDKPNRDVSLLFV